MNLRSISFLARSALLVGSLTATGCDEGAADKGKADEKKADAKAADAGDPKADDAKADDAEADDAKADDAKGGTAGGDATAAADEGADDTGGAADDAKADAKADDVKADPDEKKADPDEKKADPKKPDEKKADPKKPDEKKADDKAEVKTAKIDAKDLFDKKCKSCHGATGDAKTKLGEKHEIPDWTQPGWKAKWPRAKVVTIIADGKSGTKMKAFKDKLSKEEIDALADYSIKLGK